MQIFNNSNTSIIEYDVNLSSRFDQGKVTETGVFIWSKIMSIFKKMNNL